MSTKPRVICFDLGRVLVRICNDWRHAAEIAQLPIELPHIDDQTRQKLREVIYDCERGRMAQEEFCRRAAETFGIDAAHVSAISDIYLTGVFAGTEELLAELAAAGYATACLSNTSAHHWRIMFENGDPVYEPLRHLQHRFGSQLIGARKPDPAIFAHVEKSLDVNGEQVIFFDDMIENVEGARQRGWKAHHIRVDGDNPIEQIRIHLVQNGVLENGRQSSPS